MKNDKEQPEKVKQAAKKYVDEMVTEGLLLGYKYSEVDQHLVKESFIDGWQTSQHSYTEQKWVSENYLKSLPFHDKYFSNESWHPDLMDIKDMGQEAYDQAMAEYNKAESDVLFEGFRVVIESCDCGDGYGCSHGSWPYKILNEFDGVDMSWEDDGFYIESPKGLIRFDDVKEISMYHFVKACELLDLKLKFLTKQSTEQEPTPPTYTQEQMIAFGEEIKAECLATIRSQDDGYDNKKKVLLINISKLLNK